MIIRILTAAALGRVIPDPNASGYVQASIAGRLSPPPGGFPRLGATVEAGVSPQMGPISSIMGQVMLVAMTATDDVSSMALREAADALVRPRLLAGATKGAVQLTGPDGKTFQAKFN